MTKIKVTERVRNIEYAIRDVIVYAKHIAKTGKKIYYLNIGDPVAFDFDTPAHIKQALREAVESGENAYSPSEGLPELRQAIAQKEKRINNVNISAENVIVTTGISEGIQMVMAALIDVGDEILLPGPTYPPYISYAKFFGGKPITYETVEENGWQPNIDDLRKKISKKTRGIVIINPNNPCGALYEEKIVKQILNLAGEYDLPVLSDEIYDQIIYEKRFVSTAYLAKDVPVIGLNGFSKAHLMTGWRLGYLYFHDSNDELQELKQCIEKEARIRLCANTPVQKAAVTALNGPQDHVKELVGKLRQRRDLAWKRLNEIEGISCTKPEGAFYVFPRVSGTGFSDVEFAENLLKKAKVAVVPGSAFGSSGRGHVRCSYATSRDKIMEALNRIESFMSGKARAVFY
ncbi:MAG: aminotransferase class I/II-fold pyridoxal phosphate-dependent enzyme [Bryobacteraceae bacterium]|nr:aminotransferase class I/II-fold pyridoxal phosphate-dependent enzyme [Bryobacteraceae bacterium]